MAQERNHNRRVPGWSGLIVDLQLCPRYGPDVVQVRIDLLETCVIEDLAPRLRDATGDGRPEVLVIERDAERRARQAVWEAGPGLLFCSPIASMSWLSDTGRACRSLVPWGPPTGRPSESSPGLWHAARGLNHLGRQSRLGRARYRAAGPSPAISPGPA